MKAEKVDEYIVYWNGYFLRNSLTQRFDVAMTSFKLVAHFKLSVRSVPLSSM